VRSSALAALSVVDEERKRRIAIPRRIDWRAAPSPPDWIQQAYENCR